MNIPSKITRIPTETAKKMLEKKSSKVIKGIKKLPLKVASELETIANKRSGEYFTNNYLFTMAKLNSNNGCELLYPDLNVGCRKILGLPDYCKSALQSMNAIENLKKIK